MAEQILYGIVEQLITKVGSSAFQEIKLVYGLKNDLNEFQESLSIVKDVLLDADEEKREKSHAMENWLSRLQEIVYDADDLIDDLDYEELRRNIVKENVARRVGNFFSSSNQAWIHWKQGHRIKDLTERLNRVKHDIHILNLLRKEMVVGPYEQNMFTQRETDSREKTFGMVGREKDKKNIIESLLACEGNVSLVAIFGFGGLGKTTLAQLVYNDKQVHQYFEMKMWVCVSVEFEVKSLIKKILKCVIRIEENLDLEQLQKELQKNLGGKRYLLVLDDVWNEDWLKWDDLKKYLLDGAPGSKILVTTRSERVASVMGVKSPYKLQGLDESQSWDLFGKIAFGEGTSTVNQKMIKIGEEIVEKCKGVPLVIRTIGSLMQFKTRENEWLSVLENDLWRSCDSRGDFIPVLKLSYDHLPIHVRPCFQYCAMFPKDYEFDKEELIYLWMAQGYIVEGSSSNERLEEIGERYFNELVSRSFFQFFEDKLFTRDYYKMHDLIHDLAQSMAKDSCIAIEKRMMETVSQRVQHLYCSRPQVNSLKGLVKVKGMRTLHIEGIGGWDLTNCQKLRALHWKWISNEVPSSIGRLKHLRYLNISRSNVETIPSSVTNLHKLQALILSGCQHLRELPSDIKDLVSLRCLKVDNCSELEGMPIGLGKLTGLQSLTNFRVDWSSSKRHGNLNELENSNQLSGSLIIEGLEDVRNVESECRKVNLLKKERLQFLKLGFMGFGSLTLKKGSHRILTIKESEMLLENLQPHPNLQEFLVDGYKGVRFSNWLPGITNLITIRLTYCQNLKKIPGLGQLPFLKTLHLYQLDELEYISESDDEDNDDASTTVAVATTTAFFPSLKEIKIQICPNLKGWWRRRRSEVELRQFHCLSLFYSSNCDKLTSLTEGMPQLNSLQKLVIKDCSQLSETCHKEKGLDWPNISHISYISIDGRRI